MHAVDLGDGSDSHAVGLAAKAAASDVDAQRYVEDFAMPLKKGAKPGSKAFGRNIAAEVKSARSVSQSVAIAYAVARRGKKRKKK